jgi:hypothetical protein
VGLGLAGDEVANVRPQLVQQYTVHADGASADNEALHVRGPGREGPGVDGVGFLAAPLSH